MQTRERVPLDWARTQYNLGSAHQALGELELDSTNRTARFEAAICAYNRAQEVYVAHEVTAMIDRIDALLALMDTLLPMAGSQHEVDPVSGSAQ